MRYIVAFCSFIFSWFGVVFLWQTGMALLFSRRVGNEWQIPGFILGILAGVQAWRVSLRKARERQAEKEAQVRKAAEISGDQPLPVIPERFCPTCGVQLRPNQVQTMIGNPQYQQWCREGFCSLVCFERRRQGANQASDATSEPAPGADSSAHQG
jgi:hypothetical protein